MKCKLNITEGEVALPGCVRLLVLLICPWLALWVARRQLRLACLILQNEARCKRVEDATLIRWAGELEEAGRMKFQSE